MSSPDIVPVRSALAFADTVSLNASDPLVTVSLSSTLS